MSDDKDYEINRLQIMCDRLKYQTDIYKSIINLERKTLRWLVDHSVAAGSISKTKGAELLGIPLIDYVNENFQENE